MKRDMNLIQLVLRKPRVNPKMMNRKSSIYNAYMRLYAFSLKAY
jgi:hypothetical protein